MVLFSLGMQAPEETKKNRVVILTGLCHHPQGFVDSPVLKAPPLSVYLSTYIVRFSLVKQASEETKKNRLVMMKGYVTSTLLRRASPLGIILRFWETAHLPLP